MQNIQNLKVIIVGAGEVGMNVAMKLGKHDEIEITLVEASESRSARSAHLCNSNLGTRARLPRNIHADPDCLND